MVHPLVLLSVVDHYNRVAKDTRKRVVGVLLGETYKGRTDITNSFAGLAALSTPSLATTLRLDGRGYCMISSKWFPMLIFSKRMLHRRADWPTGVVQACCCEHSAPCACPEGTYAAVALAEGQGFPLHDSHVGHRASWDSPACAAVCACNAVHHAAIARKESGSNRAWHRGLEAASSVQSLVC